MKLNIFILFMHNCLNVIFSQNSNFIQTVDLKYCVWTCVHLLKKKTGGTTSTNIPIHILTMILMVKLYNYKLTNTIILLVNLCILYLHLYFCLIVLLFYKYLKLITYTCHLLTKNHFIYLFFHVRYFYIQF